MNLPTEIKNWLLNRNISEEIIERFKINFNGSDIVIPVFGPMGNLLFNKYRRNPFGKEDGPKYRYDFGASITLYNEAVLYHIQKKDHVFIVEGELDCLVLESLGIAAVTSTGGASSFQESWVEKFENLQNITICFDNDEAGIKGAMKVQSLLPNAAIMILPFNKGKDVTEFIQNNGAEAFSYLKAENYPIPRDATTYTNKLEVSKKKNEFKRAADLLLQRKRQLALGRFPTKHIDVMLDYIVKRFDWYKKAMQKFDRRTYNNNNATLNQVKDIPISNFIDFKNGYAPCIWHHEKTPSMFYNNFNSKFPNTVKCFSCGAMGDVVDVIMQMQNIDFQKAVNFLKNGS